MQKFFDIKVQTLETDLNQIKQDCDKLKSSFLTKEKVLCEEISSLNQILQLKEEDSSNGFNDPGKSNHHSERRELETQR